MSSTTEGPVVVESTSSSSSSATINSAVTAMDSLVTNIVESIKVVISSTTTSATPTTATITSTSTSAHTTPSLTTATSNPSVGDAISTTHSGMMNVSELNQSLQHFGIVDYLVFVLMLVICAVIGFYFGFIEKKNKKRNVEVRRGSEALDYLVGGRKMKVFPVALSLVAR